MSARPIRLSAVFAPSLALAMAAAPWSLAVAAQAPPVAADSPEQHVAPPAATSEAAAPEADAAPEAQVEHATAKAGDPAAAAAEIEIRDGGTAPEAAGGHDVAQRVAAIGAALHAGALDDAHRQLGLLAAELPPRSLTLLRMQAWYAHASGDAAGAIARYRDIVARLPDDATSAINLAILEAGNGQPERARQRLRQLRARDPGSPRIDRAISRVEAQLK